MKDVTRFVTVRILYNRSDKPFTIHTKQAFERSLRWRQNRIMEAVNVILKNYEMVMLCKKEEIDET